MRGLLYLAVAAVLVFVFAQSPQAELLIQYIQDVQASPYVIAAIMLAIVAYVGFFRTNRMGFTNFLALLFAMIMIWHGFLGLSPANPYGDWGRATGMFSMGLGGLLIYKRLKYYV